MDKVTDRMGRGMTQIPAIDDQMRNRILTAPELILEDPAVMRALVAAGDRSIGANVVDLRGVAMQRLEARLSRLEDTHRSVIAAAYDNLAGTNQVHRAVLALLEPAEFEAFLQVLGTDVADILRVDAVRLVLESRGAAGRLESRGAVRVVEPGFIDRYVGAGRQAPRRPVLLRQGQPADDRLYGEGAAWLRSEAVMRIDLGPGRLPAALAMGSEDPHQFKPSHGTDLLAFFASVFERALRRWLS